MDTAVALVQAYLQVNGYFTVVEYPVLEAYRRGPARAVTDLDVLAFRIYYRLAQQEADRLFEAAQVRPAQVILAAADGVMAWLAERGRGFPVADVRVPIVPAACLFDLANGGDKSRLAPGSGEQVYRALGRAACAAAGCWRACPVASTTCATATASSTPCSRWATRS